MRLCGLLFTLEKIPDSSKMERRKSQSSMPEIVFGDIEHAGEVYKPNDHHKKESKFYRYLALFCVLLIISVVFLTTSVAAPLRNLSFTKQIETDAYEVDVPSNEFEIADVPSSAKDLSQPNVPRIPSKLTMITELNAKCQVRPLPSSLLFSTLVSFSSFRLCQYILFSTFPLFFPLCGRPKLKRLFLPLRLQLCPGVGHRL